MNIKIRWKNLEYSARRGYIYIYIYFSFFFQDLRSCSRQSLFWQIGPPTFLDTWTQMFGGFFLFDSTLLVLGGILTLHETPERLWGSEMSPERSVPACVPSRLLTSSHSTSSRSSHSVSRGQPTGSNKLLPGHWQHISHTPVKQPPPQPTTTHGSCFSCNSVSVGLMVISAPDQVKEKNTPHISVCRDTNKVKNYIQNSFSLIA